MAATLGVFVVTRVAISTWVRPHLMPPVHQTLSLLGAGPDRRVQLGVGFSNGGPLQLFINGGGPPRSWTLSSYPVTSSGHRPTSGQLTAFVHQYCPNVGPPPAPPPGGGVARVIGQDSDRACLAQVAKHFHVLVSYQPDSRYWAFQWMEAGIFVALTAAALVACYFWVIRRAS